MESILLPPKGWSETPRVRYLGQATQVDKINDFGAILIVSKGQAAKVVKMDDLRPMGPIYV